MSTAHPMSQQDKEGETVAVRAPAGSFLWVLVKDSVNLACPALPQADLANCPVHFLKPMKTGSYCLPWMEKEAHESSACKHERFAETGSQKAAQCTACLSFCVAYLVALAGMVAESLHPNMVDQEDAEDG